MFRPLINSIFDAVSVGIDAYANFIYRLVEGRSYQEALALEEERNAEEIETDNVIKYEYIPTEEFDKQVVNKVLKYKFKEGEKEGLSFYLGEDMEGSKFKIDRKSTRLNSSHVSISYAVFCLK